LGSTLPMLNTGYWIPWTLDIGRTLLSNF
jgi:hypothetical protein